MPTKLALFRERLLAFQTTLASKGNSVKGEHVSKDLAEHFNNLVKDIGDAYPDIKESLPAALIARSTLERQLQKVSANYLDLEILVNQVLRLLALLQPEH